jgi:hypothetical protein
VLARRPCTRSSSQRSRPADPEGSARTSSRSSFGLMRRREPQLKALSAGTSSGSRISSDSHERFAGQGAGESETPADAERLNPIRALLYGLDRLQSVTVITATTSLHVRLDLESGRSGRRGCSKGLDKLGDQERLEIRRTFLGTGVGARPQTGRAVPAGGCGGSG